MSSAAEPAGRVKVGDAFELELDSVAAGGDGFGRLGGEDGGPGLAVFTDAGVPGDRVLARATQVKPRHVRASVISVLRASAHAVPPGCEVASACGGCRFWRLAYADELIAKSGAVLEAMRRIGREVVWPEPELVGAVESEGYRCRARLRYDEEGRLGFFGAGSHSAVWAQRCRVLHPALDAVRSRAGALFSGLEGARSVFLEWDDVRHGVAVTGEFDIGDAPHVHRAVRARADRLGTLHDITTIVISSGRNTSPIVGDGRVHRRRTGGAGEVVVRDPVRAFSQANARMNVDLVAAVVDAARNARTAASSAAPARNRPNLLELFAGSGNLSFPLIEAGFELDAVEVAEPAVRAAADAWRSAGAPSRARFHVADLERGLPPAVVERARAAAVVVTDPPRGGMSEPLVRDLAACRAAGTLVYVSCDPPALARDAARLAGQGWSPRSLRLLDMFPRTPHIEAVAVFER